MPHRESTGPRRAPRSITALTLALAGCALLLSPAVAMDDRPRQERPRADFAREQASAEALQLAHWVLHAQDNQGLPFLVVDKVHAKVFVFDGLGRLRGASAALLGLAHGDDTVPGIGERQLSTIRAEERTTPAGRFVASLASTPRGNDILWVDYESAVALHRVVDIPNERRLERLASSRPTDRRITYGCINVPAKFFDTVVRAAFNGTNGIAYVLPETRSLHQVFGSYDVSASPASSKPRAP
jgi:hypothetical protein